MHLYHALQRPDIQNRLFPALQQALVKKYTAEMWRTFGFQAGIDDYISGHRRLLRGLDYGDEDYGNSIYQVLSYCRSQTPSALEHLVRDPVLQSELERSVPDVMHELGLSGAHVPPVPRAELSASQVVERALADADQLLATSGPISCVDRMHTALHGYLRMLCERFHLPDTESASLTQLFKALRERHPDLMALPEIQRVLLGMASSVDALNTLRNQASLAHPNAVLLGEAEARLVVNLVRSMFHYLHAKVGTARDYSLPWWPNS